MTDEDASTLSENDAKPTLTTSDINVESINQGEPLENEDYDPEIIHAQDSVFVELPSGTVRMITVKKTGNVHLGKFGVFRTKDIIGHAYGYTYEIIDGKNGMIMISREADTFENIDEGDGRANNQEINDEGQAGQFLSYEEIEQLKQQADGETMVRTVLSNNATFEKKTPYAQAKYIRRKREKFLKRFRIGQVNENSVCDFYFSKNRDKIRSLRTDSLAQMMTLANVRPGMRALIVDDTHGLLTGAVVRRMDGEGIAFNIHDLEAPRLDILRLMNLRERQTKMLYNLSWSRVVRSGGEEPFELLDEATLEGTRLSNYLKRKAAALKVESIRNEFHREKFDALIMATQMDIPSVVEELAWYLEGSAPIVIFDYLLEDLVNMFGRMRASPNYLNVQITESFLREYQVLPGRTHPTMNTTGGSGYILSAYKVFGDADIDTTPPDKKVKTNDM